MGWFDGWFGSNNSGSDPLGKLDPKLREFLEKESPVKYHTPTQPQAQQTHQQPPPPPPSSQQQQQQQQQHPTSPPDSTVPAESLYPDGRYAHLWKTYRPLAAIEAETKSDNEKLTDVLDAFKERKGLIGRAALENCADEQFAWAECMRSGSWTARMTMCSEAVHKFERCYNAQSRLLKALGYLSVQGRGGDVDEEIQMRADELYHKMLEQEREIEKAKEEGREAPVFKSVLAGAVPPPAAAATAAKGAGPGVAEPSEALVATWKDRLEKLPPEEREAEEQALRAEYRAKAEMASKIQGLWQEQAKEREARKAEGKQTFMDRFSALAGSWAGPRSS